MPGNDPLPRPRNPLLAGAAAHSSPLRLEKPRSFGRGLPSGRMSCSSNGEAKTALPWRTGSRLSGRSGALRSEVGLGGDEIPCLVHAFNSAYSDMARPSGIELRGRVVAPVRRPK